MSSFMKIRRPPFRTYSITKLCREFGVTARAMRFYEEQGLVCPSRRDMTRVYSYKDRARLSLTVRGRRVGLSIAEIRDILDAYGEDDGAAQSVKALKTFRTRIEALKTQRVEADQAIEALQAACRRLADEFPPAASELAE